MVEPSKYFRALTFRNDGNKLLSDCDWFSFSDGLTTHHGCIGTLLVEGVFSVVAANTMRIGALAVDDIPFRFECFL